MESVGVTRSKADIDTSAPFRSVKEAVVLFGEKLLAGEVDHNKTKEEQDSDISDGLVVTTELEETKQSLQKAREESTNMAVYLTSLQQQLKQTRSEIHRLKNRESKKHDLWDLEMEEDLKFVESPIQQVKKENSCNQRVQFEKNNYVRFANPPSLVQVIVPPSTTREPMLQRHSSLKKKKKQFITYIGGIFSKKRGS